MITSRYHWRALDEVDLDVACILNDDSTEGKGMECMRAPLSLVRLPSTAPLVRLPHQLSARHRAGQSLGAESVEGPAH
jgi:hypothetical protein